MESVEAGTGIPAIRIRYGRENSQFGDLRLPSHADPHPVVVTIHGGFWRARYDLTHIEALAAALSRAGYATWNIEYRRIGEPGGGWPGTFHDVALAVDAVRGLAPEYDLDINQVVTLGHSAGGHLALWSAARRRIPEASPIHTGYPLPLRGAISLAGVTDLRAAARLGLSNSVVQELLGGTPEEVPERYDAGSPAALVPLRTRQVLIHGIADRNVPYDLSHRYHHQAVTTGDEATLITLPRAGHFEVIDPRSAAWASVLRAVRETLTAR